MSILQPEEIEELVAILNRLCPHQAGWTMEPPTEDDRSPAPAPAPITRNAQRKPSF